ncbi:MAG: sporulation protein YqfD [Clostridia bacterium]|nr:sporulation protein YqfD [Clostridia bacterium]
MEIPRIDFLIFGYRKISVDEKDLKTLLNLFLSKGISIKIYKNEFLVSERDFSNIEKLISGKIRYSASETLGLRGVFKKYKSRYGIFAALLLSALLCAFSSSRVWDIRIEGSTLGNEEKILEELSELGFSVGAPWRKFDKGKLEADMLSESESVSWININQRGSVAYVNVVDKIIYDREDEKTGFANVVAERDAVIEEITVKSGVALVKAGQTVKKGEILISGVIPAELGGGFCYAEGVVIGRITDEISVEINEKETMKEVKERKLAKLSLNFFNFSFKIFEKYRKTDEECDIIKENRDYYTFLGKKIPIFLEREYQYFYNEIDLSYTKEEMTRLAALRMRDMISGELNGKNLLKIKTFGEFSDGIYILSTRYVAESEIGKSLEFDVVKCQEGD